MREKISSSELRWGCIYLISQWLPSRDFTVSVQEVITMVGGRKRTDKLSLLQVPPRPPVFEIICFFISFFRKVLPASTD